MKLGSAQPIVRPTPEFAIGPSRQLPTNAGKAECAIVIPSPDSTGSAPRRAVAAARLRNLLDRRGAVREAHKRGAGCAGFRARGVGNRNQLLSGLRRRRYAGPFEPRDRRQMERVAAGCDGCARASASPSCAPLRRREALPGSDRPRAPEPRSRRPAPDAGCATALRRRSPPGKAEPGCCSCSSRDVLRLLERSAALQAPERARPGGHVCLILAIVVLFRNRPSAART